MTGLGRDEVIAGIEEVTSDRRGGVGTIPPEYEVTNTSERVVRFILSTVGRHREWAGLRRIQ